MALRTASCFQANGGIDSLTAQNAIYTQAVHISVQGYSDTVVNIGLSVSNPAATLSFAEGTVRNLTWVQGQGIPTAIITAVSSNSPIQFSTTSSGTIAPIIAASEASGLAYNFGTQIPVTFPNMPFSEAQPGSVLTGVVKFTWGSTRSSTVTFYVNCCGGDVYGAARFRRFPSNLPDGEHGRAIYRDSLRFLDLFLVSDPTQRTNVGIVNASNQIVADANIINTQVVNSSSIVLTIQAPALNTDPLLPWEWIFLGDLRSVQPGRRRLLNSDGHRLRIVIGAGPTISNVVSASTLTSASTPNVAPYDILTLFGTNFCTSNGTGCGAAGILYGVLNPATMTYTTALSPDGGQRNLTVSFKLHSAVASTYVAAPLLFATNSQINLVVPATGFPVAGSAVDVLVTFGGLSSNIFAVTSVLTDPGVFTIDSFGQGAILTPSYAIANGSNPALTGSVVLMYATGLGTPTSLTAGNPVAWSSLTCITPANYETIAGNGASVDGALIQSSLLSTYIPPCFGTANAPSSIKVGGVSTTIGYTGWVADSVAGLYQSNVTLPAAGGTFTDAAGTSIVGLRSPVQLPVQITSNSVASPAPGANLGLNPGVTMWVAPAALALTNPGVQSVGTMGAAWTPSVTASGGTGPYTFLVDNSATPASGLVFSVTSPTLTFVSAPTAVGVYLITVTATDAHGLTGSTTFTITVSDSSDASTVTAAATAVTASTYGTSNAAVTTVTGGGGTGPYTYTVSPSAVLSVSNAGVVSTVGSAAAGIYHANVTVTDSAGCGAHHLFRRTCRDGSERHQQCDHPYGESPV